MALNMDLINKTAQGALGTKYTPVQTTPTPLKVDMAKVKATADAAIGSMNQPLKTPTLRVSGGGAANEGAGAGSKTKLQELAGNLGYGFERSAAALLGVGEGITDIVSVGANKTLQGLTSGFGLAPNKVSDFFGSGADRALNNSVTQDYQQSIEQRYNPNDLQRKIADYGSAGVAMLPTVATGTFVSPTAGLLGLGASAAGQNAQQAKSEGATTSQALNYGVMSGALETGIESIAGAIPGLPQGRVTSLIQGIVKSPVASKLIDILGEGGEEALSTFLTPYLKRLTYDKDAASATGKEIAESAIVGSALAGIMQGANALTNISTKTKPLVTTQLNTQTQHSVQPVKPVDLTPKIAQTVKPTSDTTAQPFAEINLQKPTATVPTQNATQTGAQSVTAQPIPARQAETKTLDIQERDFSNVGNKSVKAFQFENPELHDRFATAATYMQYDLDLTTKGERKGIKDADGYYVSGWGTKRKTNKYIAKLLDDANLTYDQISKALDNIIQNHGQENYAAAKKVELVLDEILSNGYETLDGMSIPADEDYISARDRITGVQTQRTSSADTEDLPLPNTNRYAQAVNAPSDTLTAPPLKSTSQSLPQGVGAMSNPFPTAPKISKVETNTFQNSDIYNEVDRDMANAKPEDLMYDPVTEKQSMKNAEYRLADIEFEKTDLSNKDAWSGEDLDVAMGILRSVKNDAKQSGDYSEFNKWRKMIQTHGTSGGQFVQAFAKYTRTPEGIAIEAAKTLDDTDLSDGKKSAILSDVDNYANEIDAIADTDKASLIDLIKRMAKTRNTTSIFTGEVSKYVSGALEKMSYDQLKDRAMAQVRSIASDYVKASFGKKASTAQVLSHLFSLATTQRNIGSNTTFDGIDTLSNNGVPLVLDYFLGKLTGVRGVALDKSWFSSTRRKGASEAGRLAAVDVALDVDVTKSESRYGSASSRTNKMVGNAIERFYSRWEKLLSDMLYVPDQFSKGGIVAENLSGLERANRNNNVDPQDLQKSAQDVAAYRTFQNNSKLAGLSQGIHDALNVVGIGKTDKNIGKASVKALGLGDVLNRYPKVPANLASVAIDYTGGGVVKGVYQIASLINDAKSGKQVTAAQQGEACRNIGRGLTGPMMIAGFAALAAKGLIKRLNAEDDKDKKALETANGQTGTQWNITATMRAIQGGSAEWQSGDKLVSVAYLEPISAYMNIGINVSELEEKNIGTLAKAGVEGIAQSILDMPVMSNIQGIFDDMNYSTADTKAGKFIDAGVGLAVNTLTGFIPAPLRASAKAFDNNYRETYGSKSTVDQVRASVANAIPGLRQKTLAPKLTGFGQEKTYTDDTALNVLNAFVLPGAVNTYKQDAVGKEIARLASATDSVTVYPTANAPYKLLNGNKQYELTAEQRQQYQKTRGQSAYAKIEELINSKEYKEADNSTKVTYISSIYSYANAKASEEYYKSIGVKYNTPTLVTEIDGAKKQGITVADYLKTKQTFTLPPATETQTGAQLQVKKLTPLLTPNLRKYVAETKTQESAADLARLNLLQRKDLSATQKSYLSNALIGETKNPIDYTNEDKFILSLMATRGGTTTAKVQAEYDVVKKRLGYTVRQYSVYKAAMSKPPKVEIWNKQDKIDALKAAGLSQSEAFMFYKALSDG